MLSPRDIPVQTKSTRAKTKRHQTVKYMCAGSATKPASLSISGLPAPKRARNPQSDRMSMANIVGQHNPCIRRMRELHTVEIRNKHTKELVDLEVTVRISCGRHILVDFKFNKPLHEKTYKLVGSRSAYICPQSDQYQYNSFLDSMEV